MYKIDALKINILSNDYQICILLFRMFFRGFRLIALCHFFVLFVCVVWIFYLIFFLFHFWNLSFLIDCVFANLFFLTAFSFCENAQSFCLVHGLQTKKKKQKIKSTEKNNETVINSMYPEIHNEMWRIFFDAKNKMQTEINKIDHSAFGLFSFFECHFVWFVAFEKKICA